MAWDRRLLRNFDWGTLGIALLIITISLVVLYSATYGRTDFLEGVHLKQLSWLGVSLVSMFLLLCFDYQTICRYAYLLYGLLILSLIAVLLFGRIVNGARRWITFGPISIQTSELAKPILIIVLARYFSVEVQQDTTPLRLRHLLLPTFITAIPSWLIMKQPDLSTAMVLLILLAVLILVVGLHGKTLALIVCTGVASLPAAWHMLKEYQRDRLLALFNPQDDLLGIGYHAWQSKIAIGSGELWGKGWLTGTQSRLNFLPENHTDFIFAVLAEEGGFIAVIILLSLFIALTLHGLTVAYHSRDRQGALLAIGVVTLLAVQAFLNIGMTIGLLPIIGLPLPLMSYGGSSLVVTFISISLLINVRMRSWKSHTFAS